jgi:Holliday junction resolvasome RuvABC endonuclease subunit
VQVVKILALDFGTKLGWATWETTGERTARIVHGTQNLLPTEPAYPGTRWVSLRMFLASKHLEREITTIVYEDVKGHGKSGVLAAHAYGGVKAVVEMQAALWHVPVVGVGVGQVKKHATGKGNAKKLDMELAARRRGWAPQDDNAADALWILDYYLEHVRARDAAPDHEGPARAAP